VICGAPNDKLLADGISTEAYFCQRERGHLHAHWSKGYPEWWDDSYHEVNDYTAPSGIAALADHPHLNPGKSDLATRALKAMLPPDAADVAYTLENGPDPDDSPEEQAETFERAKARAIDILRGEP